MSAEIERIDGGLARHDELHVEEMVARVQKIQQVMKALMKEGTHYGTIPGTPKPSLWQPGAQILSVMFQLDPQYVIERVFDGGHLDVLSTCTLVHAPSGLRRASGAGSCSTRESKYAYRGEGRSCPECGAGAIRKSKFKPGFYCHAKVGGCGFEFAPDDERISKQEVGRVANPDLADVYNTVLKMANKRAFVAAVLAGTGASDIFTQDLEEDDEIDGAAPKAGPAKPEPAADPLVVIRAQTIHQLFAKKFGAHDRDVALATLSRDCGRVVTSSKDLTKAEFEKVCATWNHLTDGTGQVAETAAPAPSAAPHEAKAPAAAAGGGAASDNGLPFNEETGMLGERIAAAARRAGRTSDEHPDHVQVDMTLMAALGITGGWRDPFDLVRAGVGPEVLDYYTKLADAAEGVKS